MSSFSEVVRYLKREPARIATSADLHQSLSLINPDKYITRDKARAIKRVPLVFYVPNTIFPSKASGNSKFIIGQFNYSFPEDFYITKLPIFGDQLDQLANCDLCIRYRIGTQVYRYHFGQYIPDYMWTPSEPDFAPQYNKQLIKKNFVIECWIKLDTGHNAEINSAGDGNYPFEYTPLGFRFETSLKQDPETANQTEAIGSNSVLVTDELFEDLPYNFPDEYINFNPLGPWLDNV